MLASLAGFYCQHKMKLHITAHGPVPQCFKIANAKSRQCLINRAFIRAILPTGVRDDYVLCGDAGDIHNRVKGKRTPAITILQGQPAERGRGAPDGKISYFA